LTLAPDDPPYCRAGFGSFGKYRVFSEKDKYFQSFAKDSIETGRCMNVDGSGYGHCSSQMPCDAHSHAGCE
jgi:hypothetical protein